jgi:hypothetical protein
MIVQMNGNHTIELADEHTPSLGHLITDMGRFLGIVSPEPVRIYMETPEPGKKPLVTIVPLKNGRSDPERTVRKRLEKAEVLRVST